MIYCCLVRTTVALYVRVSRRSFSHSIREGVRKFRKVLCKTSCIPFQTQLPKKFHVLSFWKDVNDINSLSRTKWNFSYAIALMCEIILLSVLHKQFNFAHFACDNFWNWLSNNSLKNLIFKWQSKIDLSIDTLEQKKTMHIQCGSRLVSRQLD